MIKKLGTPGTTTVKSGFYWAECTRCCTNTWYKTWYRRGTWSVRLTQRAGDAIQLLISLYTDIYWVGRHTVKTSRAREAN